MARHLARFFGFAYALALACASVLPDPLLFAVPFVGVLALLFGLAHWGAA